MDDQQLRARIYSFFAEHGTAPSHRELELWAGGAEPAQAALHRLHEAHALVLEPGGGDIGKALPFSARPTDHVVRSMDRQWWANCAWDALAIPVTVGVDASIEAPWMDDGTPVGLAVKGGKLSSTDGFVHFTIPARHWWDDIAET